jgi:hypothetical protein
VLFIGFVFAGHGQRAGAEDQVQLAELEVLDFMEATHAILYNLWFRLNAVISLFGSLVFYCKRAQICIFFKWFMFI